MKKYKKVEFLTKLGKINFKYLTENLAFDNSFSLEDTKLAENIIESLKNTNTVPFEWTPQEEEFIKNEPKSKWLKYLTYRYKLKKYPKQHIVSDFPFYVLVEPVSSCNLRCVMCYQTDKTFTRKPYMGLMKMELYKNIIDQLVEGETRALTMASRGEPSMHPKFGEMLEYASGKFYDFKINTNATRLNENMCHEILSSGVNVLTFSIDAHEKKLYEEIRVRGKLEINTILDQK